MKTEDLNAALQALDIIAGTVVDSKRLDVARAEAERDRAFKLEAIKHEADIREKQMFVQNSLEMRNGLVAELKQKQNVLAESGFTLEKTESAESKELLSNILSPKVQNTEAIGNQISQLEGKINSYSSYISASNKGKEMGVVADSNKDGILSQDEYKAYWAANKDNFKAIKANPELTRAFKSGMQSISLGFMDQQKLKTEKERVLTLKSQGDASDESVLASKTKRLQSLDEMNNFILSATPPEDLDARLKMKSGIEGAEGRQLYQSINSMTAEELVQLASDSDIDYLDEASGMPDISDEVAWLDAFKDQALTYAKENRAYNWMGLGEDDIDSAETGEPTSKYKSWEESYLTIARKALHDNKSYEFKTRTALFAGKGEAEKVNKVRFEEEYASLAAASTNMKSLIGHIDTDGKIEYTHRVKDIVKKAKDLEITDSKGNKKKWNPSAATVESLLDTIMRLPDDPLLARELMRDNEQVGRILSILRGGKTYRDWIVELSRKLEKEELFVKKYHTSDETQSIMNKLNTKVE